MTEITKRKILRGVVVSDKMKDTAVVEVERFEKHPKYQKFITYRKKYKAHDPGNAHKAGEKVTVEECRPLSKDKHYRIVETS